MYSIFHYRTKFDTSYKFLIRALSEQNNLEIGNVQMIVQTMLVDL